MIWGGWEQCDSSSGLGGWSFVWTVMTFRGMGAGLQLSSDTMTMYPQHSPCVTAIQSQIQTQIYIYFLPQGWDGGISRIVTGFDQHQISNGEFLAGPALS